MTRLGIARSLLWSIVLSGAAVALPQSPPESAALEQDLEEVDAAMAEAGRIPVRVHEFLTEQFFVEYQPGEARDVR